MFYAASSVLNMNHKHVFDVVKGSFYYYFSMLSKFEGVLQQVNQHLLQANFVSNEAWQSQ